MAQSSTDPKTTAQSGTGTSSGTGTGGSSGSTTPSSAKSRGDADVELIREQLERVREDVASLADMIGMSARSRFADAKEQVASSAQAAKVQATDQFSQTINEVESSVRRNPLAALAIMLGIGYIFGAFRR